MPVINENEQRAYRAEDCLHVYWARRGYRAIKGQDICDLIADLMHLAEREGLDAEGIHRMARQHWAEERDQ